MTTFLGLTLSHGMKMYIITLDAILYKAQYIYVPSTACLFVVRCFSDPRTINRRV